MPEKYEGLLDQDRMHEVNLDSATFAWKSVRPARWSLDVVRPQFLSSRAGSPKKRLRPTAWLDGLRGFAALLVYFHHNQLWAHGLYGNHIFENAFGYEGKHYFATLPFVRHFFSGGHFAVAIFFVISGYVLSVKPLGLIHKGQRQNAADNIGSALFRRWLRLYIPVIAVSFICLVIRHYPGIYVAFGETKESFREDLWTYYTTFKNYSFVFLTGELYEFPLLYHPHAWSIPIEFKGSIIIYTTVSALSKCTRNARLLIEILLTYYFLYVVDGWYGALFMYGCLLCDLELLALNGKLPHMFSLLENFKELIFFHLFIAGMYLGGVPSCDGDNYMGLLRKSPGWIWLSHLKPQAVYDAKWFYLFWAAIFTVSSVPRLPWLKQFFETRFCQYLARISFALYLVHGPVIWLLGDRLYAAVGLRRVGHKESIPMWVDKFPLSTKGPIGLELAFWATQVIILPITLWAAEVVTRLFDEQSVRFANWLYNKSLAQPSSPKPLA
ncbi:acyltransferas-like protein [Bimuria novae-zelandiae CBS 107.79]|uniref:Acyltransferas-like protein n=1 Tax=Bimuria novae-zelandiae CBS 107.79 TaxID=1447943 RepID=A0A6A5VA68_9PLEO|nr:acyltransferas-like protein [Bimuria novae-zelandiae CBS 107.79]